MTIGITVGRIFRRKKRAPSSPTASPIMMDMLSRKLATWSTELVFILST
jgi:hypothetical protein